MTIETFTENLKWRYATKSFDATKKIPKDLLNKILEAARLTPSSFGLQPWKFFVVENPKIRELLKAQAWNQPQITECSELIVFANRVSIDADYINSYADRIAAERGLSAEAIEGYRGMMLGALPMMQGEAGQAWMTKQLYIALGTVMAACAEAKVDSCPMEGFDPGKFDEILGLPEKGYHARVLCALGYRSSSDKAAELKKIRFESSSVLEFI
jgi:nitroreductase